MSFPGNLPEYPDSDQWVQKWTNLKHINDAVTIFLTEECDQRLPLPSGAPDLKSIAQSSSLHDTVALLKLLVVAAINCRDRIDYLTRMQELDGGTQEVLMATAQEAGEDNSEQLDTGREEDEEEERPRTARSERSQRSQKSRQSQREDELDKAVFRVDSDLASEERLGRVLADNQRVAHEKRDIERQLDEAYARHERLQQSLDRTHEELKETKERLTAVLAGKADGANRQDAKSETIIAQLESRAESAETEMVELRKTNEFLKIRAERSQKLQDDYDEVKIDRDRLARKANAAEKYKQKLEASQDLERDNQSLRDRVSKLQSQIKQSDTSTVASTDLQREVDEYRRLLPSIEQERYELSEMKKRLELDYHALEARYYDASEQLQRQQQQVEDLQGRLRDYDDGIIPATKGEDSLKTYDQEEEEFAESEARLAAALVNGDNEGEAGISEEELKAIMGAMRAQAQVGTANERESSTRAQKKLLIAVERTRSKNKEFAEHIKKQSELISQLQSQPAAAEVATPPPKEESPEPTPQPTEPRERAPSLTPSEEDTQLEAALKANTNLKRELNLMTSAWYEQQKRIVSGGMMSIRNRSSPEPRSFLGRQRKLVDPIVLGGKAGR